MCTSATIMIIIKFKQLYLVSVNWINSNKNFFLISGDFTHMTIYFGEVLLSQGSVHIPYEIWTGKCNYHME